MSQENSTNDAKVELTVRCAMQTFTDRTVECPLSWTVLQLKQHLNKTCPNNPEVSRQRLIYAGYCLENDKTIGSILRRNESGSSDEQSSAPQVIHLVCANKDGPNTSNAKNSDLRQRRNVPNVSSPPSASMPPNFIPMNNPHSQEAFQNQFYQSLALQQQMAQQQIFGSNFFMNPYQQANDLNAQQQFLNGVGQLGTWNPFSPQQMMQNPLMYGGFPPAYFPGGQMMFGGIVDPNLMVGPGPFPIPAEQQNQQNHVQAPAPEVRQEHTDFLALIYKGIRLALLMMVLYLYSSFDRFFAVVFLISMILYIQHRRENQRQAAAAAAAAAQVNPPAAVGNDNNNNDANTPDQEAAQQQNNIPGGQPQPTATTNPTTTTMNAWNVFCTTVTSFFASLIPENPQVPVNVN